MPEENFTIEIPIKLTLDPDARALVRELVREVVREEAEHREEYEALQERIAKARAARAALDATAKAPQPTLAEYARDTLGLTLWSKQVEVLDAVENRSRVFVSAADKTGATTLAAAAALGWAARGGRVIVMAGTDRALDDLIGRRIAILAGGKLPQNVHLIPSGKVEGIAGYSGPALYVIDNAHGLSREAWDVIDGNSLGGSPHVLAIGQRVGTDFERGFEQTVSRFVLSAEEVAETGIRGLATRKHVEECRALWGADSNLYRVRVQGLAPEESPSETYRWDVRESPEGGRALAFGGKVSR